MPLEHAYLAYDGWAYALGTLRPGESVEIDRLDAADELEDLHEQRFDGLREPCRESEKGPYDRSSRDMAYVLQAMMFYDAAGGRKRTGHGQ